MSIRPQRARVLVVGCRRTPSVKHGTPPASSRCPLEVYVHYVHDVNPRDFPVSIGIMAGRNLLGAAATLAVAATLANAATVPLARAYAHNDQEKPGTPLEAALANGFCHIEPDINLQDGEIVIGHDCGPLDPPCNVTLRAAYLEPLAAAYVQNGGFVHPLANKLKICQTVTLNLDVKTSAGSTYEAIHDLLATFDAAYPGFLTTFALDQVVSEGAVRVLISGNRPSPEEIAAQERRYAALDGRILENLDEPWTHAVVGWLSQSWSSIFDSTEVPFSNATCEHIQDIARTAHARGQLIRFWAIPQEPDFWSELIRCDCDIINGDDYDLLTSYLLNA